MIGRKCTLCGRRLNEKNICTECGLNNSKSDKKYKINQSSYDKKPPTHVHEEKQKNIKQEKTNIPRQAPASGKHKQRKTAAVLSCISAILVIVSVIAPLVWSERNEYYTDSGFEEEYDDTDPYEYVQRELSEEGSKAEYLLGRGEYIAGVHIPEGKYAAEAADEFDTIQVEDPANGIYLYEYMEKTGEDYLDDLRLYSGAHVIIETDTVIKLSTENAQISEMYGIENPLTKAVRLSGAGIKTAGKDFKPGVYDLKLAEGSGEVQVMLSGEDTEAFDEEYADEEYFDEEYFDEEYPDGEYYDEEYYDEGYFVRQFFLLAEGSGEYKNLVLAPGMGLLFEEDDPMVITLTPSEKIENTDYTGYYSLTMEGEEDYGE